MTLWLVLAGLAAVVTLLLLRPLWRPGPPAAADPEVALYRDQLAEIERDAASGRLSAAEVAAARLEVQRRLLAAADSAATEQRPRAAGRSLAVPIAALLIAGSLALYLELGAPGSRDQPFAARPSDPGAAADTAAIASLRQRLAAAPEDLPAWLELGRSLQGLHRFGESAEAFSRALALAPERPDVAAAFGEALVLGADGIVTPAAQEAFRHALAGAPGDPRTRYYLALAQAQAGDVRGAIAGWNAILQEAPPDAPYRAMIQRQIAESAAANGIAPDQQAAAPSDQAAMIRGMVDGLAARLEADPRDVEGWLRLARSYDVLGERDRARAALARAVEQAPQRLDVLGAYARSLHPAGAEDPSPEFLSVQGRILALDPDNPEAMWFIGLDALQRGDKPRAAELFRRLLDRLPPDASIRGIIQRQLDAAGS